MNRRTVYYHPDGCLVMTYLTEFMNRRMGITALWQPGETEAIWRHQLNARLEADLKPGCFASRVSQLSQSDIKIFRGKSFGELLKHPQAPLELLKLIKEFAKKTFNQPMSRPTI